MTAGSNELGRVRFRKSTLYNKVEEKRIPMTSKFAIWRTWSWVCYKIERLWKKYENTCKGTDFCLQSSLKIWKWIISFRKPLRGAYWGCLNVDIFEQGTALEFASTFEAGRFYEYRTKYLNTFCQKYTHNTRTHKL